MRGELAAASEMELDGRLLQIGLQLITCKPQSRRRGRAGGVRVARRELINFCFHLGQAHKAGLPILEALGDLRDSTENTAFRNVLASLSLAVESGRSLSDAMAIFPATFDHVFVSLIRAGEKSGELSAGAREDDRDAQVAGRADGADEEARHVPGLRRHRGHGRGVLPDDLRRAADERVPEEHGPGDAACTPGP